VQRYPTTKSGLALPITEIGYEVVERERRLTNRHHLYYSRCWYKDQPIRHLFRNLVDHVVDMRVRDHDELHNRFLPPLRPPEGLMIDVLDEYMALNGVLNCVKERKTSEIYQVQQPEWEHLRGLHGQTSSVDRREVTRLA
jgi:hypothetical protein